MSRSRLEQKGPSPLPGVTSQEDHAVVAPATKQTRRWSWRVATIDGIDVRLHASLLLLVWLLLFVALDDLGEAARTAVFLSLLFVCVLVHEFAHCVVARGRGVGVVEIELLPLGGLSKMDHLPDEPDDELAIALAGPLTSLAIGGLVLALAQLAGGAIWPPDLAGGLVPALGWVNVLLAGFNLLPALPLDGGRALRAILEPRTGPTEATRIAARWGRTIAIGMVGIGALVNLWLVLIGVFVYVSSNAEEAGAIVHEQLAGLTARDLMVSHPIVVSPRTTMGQIYDTLPTTSQRQFPVVSATGDYLGMLDITATTSQEPAVPVGEVLDAVPPIRADAPAEAELSLLGRGGRSAVAVVDDTSVVGILRADDITRVANRALTTRRSPTHRSGRR